MGLSSWLKAESPPHSPSRLATGTRLRVILELQRMQLVSPPHCRRGPGRNAHQCANERYNILNTARILTSRNTPCAHHAITRAKVNTTKNYHAATDCFQTNFRGQILSRDRKCPTCSYLR